MVLVYFIFYFVDMHILFASVHHPLFKFRNTEIVESVDKAIGNENANASFNLFMFFLDCDGQRSRCSEDVDFTPVYTFLSLFIDLT